MDKVIIHKNKPEAFKCQISVEGAKSEDVSVRMLLEFDDNKNMFFYGNVQEDGTCVIKIPKLKEIENKSGKLVIEAIADNTRFELYEAKVDLKNSVEIKMVKEAKQSSLVVKEDIAPKFVLEKIQLEETEPQAPIQETGTPSVPTRKSKKSSPMDKLLDNKLSKL